MPKKKVEEPTKIVNQEAPKDVYTQLFAFQNKELVIPRRGTSEINGKTYRYVLLDDLIFIIRPMLQELGLLFVQKVNGSVLETEIRHVQSGTNITSQVALGNPASAQDLGARITYMRRYALTALLGIVADDDIDAKPVEDKKPSAPAPTEAPGRETKTVVEDGYSQAFKNAKGVIESCQNSDAMEVLKGQISRSSKLSQKEKDELMELLDQKDHEINGTVS